jgi:uncharacterized YigZ family protein
LIEKLSAYSITAIPTPSEVQALEMPMIDSYRTIAEPTTSRLTRSASRFLAFLYPVSSPSDVQLKLAELRRAYHDATHRCSAFRLLGPSEPLVASDDAGEPTGSAGPPILHRLEETDLLDVLAVVVRYFGGKKLGLGGLIRAYGEATQAAIDASRIVVRQVLVELAIRFPADVNSGVMATIHRYKATVRDIRFGTSAEARIALAPSRVPSFRAAIREATANRASTEVLG